MSEVQKTMARLNELNRERADLYRELNAAIAIECIWPDSFKDGMRCAERAIIRGGKIADTWLCRSDGVTLPITLQQFEFLQGFREANERCIT